MQVEVVSGWLVRLKQCRWRNIVPTAVDLLYAGALFFVNINFALLEVSKVKLANS